MIQKNIIIKERIKNIIEKWYILEPLYFIVFTTHELVLNVYIKTIRTGNGKIEFNPEFINSINDKELTEILRCEIIRILLKHPYNRKKENQQVAYLASNITIKEYINTWLNFPTAEQQFNSYSFNRKHFELYYYKIIEQSQNQLNNKSDNKDNSEPEDKKLKSKSNKKVKNKNEEDDNEQTIANKNDEIAENESEIEKYENEEITGTENTENWDTDELFINAINNKIEIAIQSNAWGTISGSLREQIIASLKPKIDYRSVLKAFRASVISQNRVLTRMKPSRRYEFEYMGSRRDFTTKLLFAVDVSGSMDNLDLQNGFSIINHFFKYGIQQIDVIQFDTEIKGNIISLKKAKNEISIMGRGGTDFQCVIDFIDDKKYYDGLIIFTDGFASIPKLKKNRKTRILWIFNSENNFNYINDKINKIGKAVFLKEK